MKIVKHTIELVKQLIRGTLYKNYGTQKSFIIIYRF